jgi:hypothetical protein
VNLQADKRLDVEVGGGMTARARPCLQACAIGHDGDKQDAWGGVGDRGLPCLQARSVGVQPSDPCTLRDALRLRRTIRRTVAKSPRTDAVRRSCTPSDCRPMACIVNETTHSVAPAEIASTQPANSRDAGEMRVGRVLVAGVFDPRPDRHTRECKMRETQSTLTPAPSPHVCAWGGCGG